MFQKSQQKDYNLMVSLKNLSNVEIKSRLSNRPNQPVTGEWVLIPSDGEITWDRPASQFNYQIEIEQYRVTAKFYVPHNGHLSFLPSGTALDKKGTPYVRHEVRSFKII